jgi:tetratricopeptide (TPR) repeat protein
LYTLQNRLDAARAEFERVAELRPASAVAAHTLVGMILQAQGKQAEAQARYEKVIGLDSSAAVAANNLAWLYAERGGNLDIALQLAQTAKKGLPDRPEVNDTLGWIYYRKNLPNLAVPPLKQSVDANPKNAVYQYHLGLAYLKTGDEKAAEIALKQALKLDPKFEGSVEAQKLLADIQG